MYESWRTSDNETINPPTYSTFWIYNITNHEDVIANGSTVEVTLVGPYVFRTRYEKYNVEYSPGLEEVMYSQLQTYLFEEEMSAPNKLTDLIWQVNLPFVGGGQMFYSLNQPVPLDQYLLCDVFGETGTRQACMFGLRNVTEVLFTQHSEMLDTSSGTYFAQRPVNPDFQLFYNHSSAPDSDFKTDYLSNYGFGGHCELVRPAPPTPGAFFTNQWYCLDPASTNDTDTRHVAVTGHGGRMDDLWKIVKFLGNETIDFWNTTMGQNTTADDNGTVPNITLRLETVKGSNSDFQFKTNLDKNYRPTVFDGTAMRNVDMQYVTSHSEYGVELWRFRTYDDLYAGDDTYYFGSNTTPGLLNASSSAVIVHGATCPIYASMAYMAGVDETIRNTYICNNCPDIDQTASLDDLNYKYGSWFEVNPVLGKTLKGQEVSQLNVLIGQDFWGRTTPPLECIDKLGQNICPYRKVPETYVPILIFNVSASFNETQASIVRDGLDQLDMGHAAYAGILYGGIVVTILSFLLHIFLHRRAKALADDSTKEGQYSMINSGGGTR
jgi:hypothetical protein